MKMISLIANNIHCGSNYVHYLLAQGNNKWSILSLRGENNKLYDLPINNLKLSRFKMLFKILKKIEVLYEIKNAQIILADGIFPYIYGKLIRRYDPNIKVFFLVHNDYSINNRSNWGFIPKWLFNFIYDYLLKSEKVITTSISASEGLKRRNIKSFHIDNGCIPPINGKDKNKDSNILNYWYVGRLVKAKQVDLLIKSFHNLPSNCKLNIIGDGDEKEKLKKLSIEENINCKFWGEMENPFSIVHPGDVFVLPSLIEGKSIALMEAILSNCYCIASDIEANREFERYNVTFFSVFSLESLNSELFYSSKLSQKQRTKVTKFDLATQDFSPKEMQKKYMKVFNENYI
ncbi:glycosyltransferase family 4 protein [Xenorhabdus sp. Vera]|uniref:glycosyltransferase family 4 protein n=1 Tax=Xenorhabdus koppenhoeferi TaxID=351659 RepID=UPI0019CF4A10|nr:glycosyltransferase family 4 protein [Xenorhabdus sp. Vera]MBD2809884.1 glycosyltransferase family 4 protein [Xenorhabdus sp. Vera]